MIVAVVMVAGWPIAHHVWAGNEVDHTTVGKAIADLHRRFGFNRLVFVGDRGMVTSNNLDAITAGNHDYLVGLKRRRNKKLDKWLAAVDEAKWINCPVGITAREKIDPPRTRAQEVPSGIAGMRVELRAVPFAVEQDHEACTIAVGLELGLSRLAGDILEQTRHNVTL